VIFIIFTRPARWSQDAASLILEAIEMSTWTKIALAAAITLGTASASLGRGFVMPCSLDGVNPQHHHRIFRHFATEYGFIESASGVWYVRPGCHR
jgi:hypothetical protein